MQAAAELLAGTWRSALVEAGHVEWLREAVAKLDQQQLVHGVVRTVQGPDGRSAVEARAGVNVWVRLYHDERDRLVRVAKAAIDAGVAERQVKLAEEQAKILARVVTAIVTDLGHDMTDENVRNVVRLRLLEGGAESEAGELGPILNRERLPGEPIETQ